MASWRGTLDRLELVEDGGVLFTVTREAYDEGESYLCQALTEQVLAQIPDELINPPPPPVGDPPRLAPAEILAILNGEAQ